jgi:hypothetical protein
MSTRTPSIAPTTELVIDLRRRWSQRISVKNVLVAVSVGTLLVAAGYAGGRYREAWAPFAFWSGWVESVLVLAWAITSPALSARGRVLIVVLQALQQSIIEWMYSPLRFTFPDELQHWRTAVDILSFQHLFHTNPLLPISAVFPGLELMTTALVSVSHVGLFPAGLIIAATSHVALAAAMFYLFARVTDDQRIAGVAAFVFAFNPLHAGFDTLFVYEGPALLFGAVVLGLAVDRRRQGPGELIIALTSLAALVVTHHLTAAFILGALGVVGVLLALLRVDRAAKRTLGLFVAGMIMAAVWIATEARPVLGYLGGPLATAISGVLHFGGKAGAVALPASTGPTPGAFLVIIGTIITAALVALGAWRVLRHWGTDDPPPTARVFLICALSYFAVLGVRQFAPDGAELAGRLLTFAAFFTAVSVAVVLMGGFARRPEWGRFVRPVAVAAMLLIFLGGMMSGNPAPWEQLPGHYHVAGNQSGIDRQNVLAARWFRANVGSDQRIACDFSECGLLGAYAEAHPVEDAPSIYYAPTMSAGVRAYIQKRAISYVMVDTRMSTQKPVTGHFFLVGESDADLRSGPIPLSALTKFRYAPGVKLIYDSGPIQIYDLRDLPK